jgi:hypoxanthine phosphoribosyltransferase
METIEGGDYVIPSAAIGEAVEGLAKEILANYPNGVVIVGIREGAVVLLNALEEAFEKLKPKVRPMFATIGAQSYAGSEQRKAGMNIYGVPSRHLIRNKKVVLLDDVIDTGKTAHTLAGFFKNSLQAGSLEVGALCVKGDVPKWVNPAYIAFQLPKTEFVVGFGMDYKGLYREQIVLAPLTDEQRKAADIVAEKEARDMIRATANLNQISKQTHVIESVLAEEEKAQASA